MTPVVPLNQTMLYILFVFLSLALTCVKRFKLSVFYFCNVYGLVLIASSRAIIAWRVEVCTGRKIPVQPTYLILFLHPAPHHRLTRQPRHNTNGTMVVFVLAHLPTNIMIVYICY